MHLEFAACLAKSVHSLGQKQLINVLPNELPSAFHWHDMQVDTPPPEISALVTSSIAFPIAAKAAHRRRSEGLEPFSPAEIANALATRLANFSWRAEKLFSVEIGGGGHLNADPTMPFMADFVSVALRTPAREFLRSESFFCVDPIDVSACGCHRLLTLPSEAELLAEWEKNEPTEAALWRKWQASEKQTATDERLLMLLAQKADRELNLRPFFHGLHGRENIPWYLRRYYIDSKRFFELTPMRDLPSREMLANVIGCLEPKFATAPRLRLLFGVRHRYRLAAFLCRPEIFFEHLLGIVRDFYSYFHQPSYRLLSAKDSESEELLVLYALSKKLFEIVDAGLQELWPGSSAWSRSL